MEVVSNSRANPVNRIMGRAQFDFLPPNIVNPKMLEGIVQERTVSSPKSQIPVFMYAPSSMDQLNGGGHVSLDIVTCRG